MKFHLNYSPEPAAFSIDHKNSILLVGSCFAENIGGFLKDSKFTTRINPNGILFNPLSVLDCISSAVQNLKIQEDFLLEREGLFYSYLHHSSYSSTHKKELLKNICSETENTHYFLKSADFLIITFGTAFVYYHKQLGQPVANCHKQPSEVFTKKMLEVNEITSVYTRLIEDLKAFNPALKIIFTVSPVKYLKDGIEENNLSKSTLLLGIHKLVEQHQHCSYFPAFEFVNDDLRDYRFYKEDLAHPNDLAIEYIWQKFSECYFKQETLRLNQQIQKLNQVLNHRQINKNSLENEKLSAFIEKQKEEIKKLDPSIEF